MTKDLSPHSARHTFASWALMEGVAPQIVQHRLGHESLETTSRRYAHLLLDAQRAAVDAIGWEPSPGT
ncbi:tyrosine-type recombinase/integrase [Micrococcus luteus]|uniref:tyrosine-type recombinase/integrase n=1 Tax=Micrococcus luteus TaxID=1270 RepID=UPI002A415227|nr:tyrosine-type recombinase/integrase [Micrococcus luteus]